MHFLYFHVCTLSACAPVIDTLVIYKHSTLDTEQKTFYILLAQYERSTHLAINIQSCSYILCRPCHMLQGLIYRYNLPRQDIKQSWRFYLDEVFLDVLYCYELSDPQSVTQPSQATLASLGHRARARNVWQHSKRFTYMYMLCLLSSRLYIRNTVQLHFIHLRVQYTLLSRDSTSIQQYVESSIRILIQMFKCQIDVDKRLSLIAT